MDNEKKMDYIKVYEELLELKNGVKDLKKLVDMYDVAIKSELKIIRYMAKQDNEKYRDNNKNKDDLKMIL